MSRVATSHRRRLPAAALLVLAAFACDDGGLEPEDVIGTYDLTEYLGQPLPVVVGDGLTDPGSPVDRTCETLLNAGSIDVQRGGSYTQVWSRRTTCQDGRDFAKDSRADGTWRIELDRVRLRQPLEGGEAIEWVAYLRGERLKLEVVIPFLTENFPDPGPNTPADTTFIVYRRR